MVGLVHFCSANSEYNASSTGAFYEYDTTRNGWYLGSTSTPIMVNLREHHYHGVPDRYHDFVNRTLARQPNGVCQKEIP